MQKINWGILGAGYIADLFLADLQLVEQSCLYGIASRDVPRGEAMARKYGVQKVYSSYEAMLQDADIDVIYIATPHNLHEQHAVQCLKQGKHVLCEKPLTVNRMEAERVIACAKSESKLLMEAMWTPFLPAIQKAQEWLSGGVIGDLVSMQANFGFNAYAMTNSNLNHRLFNPALAGGSLLDIGIYVLTFAQLFAKSTLTEKQVLSSKAPSGVDDALCINLQYQNGVSAQLATSFKTDMTDEAVLYGTKGRIVIPDFWQAKKTILYQGGTEELFEDASEGKGYRFEADHLNELLLSGATESPVIPFRQSLEMLDLMDDIRQNIGLVYPFE